MNREQGIFTPVPASLPVPHSLLPTPYSLLPLLLCLLLSACDTTLSGNFTKSGALELKINASLKPALTSLLKKQSSISGSDDNKIIFLNAGLLQDSFSNIQGVSKASFKNKNPSSVEGELTINDINTFLSAFNKKIITLKNNQAAFYFDKTTGEELISYLSTDLKDYLSALFVPIATGEDLSQDEYLNLISDVYGGQLKNEAQISSINASFTFPWTVSSAKSSAGSAEVKEGTALFKIPLLNFISPEKPLSCDAK